MNKTEIKEIIDREIDASTKSFCRVIKCDANTTRLTTLISEHDLAFAKHSAKLKNDIQAYDVEMLVGLIAMTINKAVISRLSFSDEPLTLVGKDDLIVIIKPVVVVEDQDHDFVVFVEYAIVDMSNNQ